MFEVAALHVPARRAHSREISDRALTVIAHRGPAYTAEQCGGVAPVARRPGAHTHERGSMLGGGQILRQFSRKQIHQGGQQSPLAGKVAPILEELQARADRRAVGEPTSRELALSPQGSRKIGEDRHDGVRWIVRAERGGEGGVRRDHSSDPFSRSTSLLSVPTLTSDSSTRDQPMCYAGTAQCP